MLLFLIACSIKQHHGLLVNHESKMALVDIQGKEYSLHLGEDGQFLQHLQGVILRVDGPKLANHIWVTNWRVVDGGDGSAPYLGILYRQGIQWMINDIQSGSKLLIDNSSEEWKEGQAILIVGYVTGKHRVHVVSYRILGTADQE